MGAAIGKHGVQEARARGHLCCLLSFKDLLVEAGLRLS